VQGDNILSDVQQYALVATGCFDGKNNVRLASSSTNSNVYDGDNSAEERRSTWSTIGIVIGVVIGVIFAGMSIAYFLKK